MDQSKRLLEPASQVELLRGWLLHAHKGRDRHDTAARRFEGRRIWFGVPTIVLSTAVGTSVLSATHQPGTWQTVAVGLLSITAAVLAALQTFLNYPARADRHRLVAVKYKAIIRELEQVLAGSSADIKLEAEWLSALRQRFDTLEEEAPVVAPGIYEEVEEQYKTVTFVTEALALYRDVSPRA